MYKYCPNCGGAHEDFRYRPFPSCPHARANCSVCNGIWHTSWSCERYHRGKTTGRYEPGYAQDSPRTSRDTGWRPSPDPQRGNAALRCDRCPWTFFTELELNSHIQKYHDKKLKGDRESYPNTTGMGFERSETSVPPVSISHGPVDAKHPKVVHPKKSDIKSATNASYLKTINYHCLVVECGSGFTKLNDLRQHMNICPLLNAEDGDQMALPKNPSSLVPVIHDHSSNGHSKIFTGEVGTLQGPNQQPLNNSAQPANVPRVSNNITHPKSERDMLYCRWCRNDGITYQIHGKSECPRAGPLCPECKGGRKEHHCNCSLGKAQGCPWCFEDGIPGQAHGKRECPRGGVACSECGLRRNMHPRHCSLYTRISEATSMASPSTVAIRDDLKRKRSTTTDEQPHITPVASATPPLGDAPESHPSETETSQKRRCLYPYK